MSGCLKGIREITKIKYLSLMPCKQTSQMPKFFYKTVAKITYKHYSVKVFCEFSKFYSCNSIFIKK